MAVQLDDPVAAQSRRFAQSCNAVLKTAGAQTQQPSQLTGHGFYQLAGGPTGRDSLRRGPDAIEIAGISMCVRLLPVSPRGQLRHTYTDGEQQHRGLDVITVVDCERLVRPGEEEVE